VIFYDDDVSTASSNSSLKEGLQSMFVIGRTVHEQIQIGNSVTVKVLRIGDKHVTLGIDAPTAIPLSREDTGPGAMAQDAEPVRRCDLSVLVIDDTPIHTWLVQKAFNGYVAERTRVVRSGKDALRLLGDPSSGCYDLIVMDLHLPDIPGLELLRKIRSLASARVVPVVVMSYQDSDTEVARCLEAGANAFVPKPETQEGFRQAVFRIADFWSHTRRVSGSILFHPAAESLVC
jgi:carbon storage regulator CsrA